MATICPLAYPQAQWRWAEWQSLVWGSVQLFRLPWSELGRCMGKGYTSRSKVSGSDGHRRVCISITRLWLLLKDWFSTESKQLGQVLGAWSGMKVKSPFGCRQRSSHLLWQEADEAWASECPNFKGGGFPGGSPGKESVCNAGDPGLIPGLGCSPGEGKGYPLQYSWAFLVAQTVKDPPAMQETWVWFLGWEDPELPTKGACYATVNSYQLLCYSWLGPWQWGSGHLGALLNDVSTSGATVSNVCMTVSNTMAIHIWKPVFNFVEYMLRIGIAGPMWQFCV